MTAQQARQEARAMHQRGELSADEYEQELAGIDYAAGEEMSEADDRRGAAS